MGAKPNAPSIAILGGTGRLGRLIVELLRQPRDSRTDIVLAKGGILQRGDLEKGVPKALKSCSVLLDVSRPDACHALLVRLLEQGLPPALVIGSTGWTDKQMKAVHQYSRKASVVLAPNFSPGVNLFLRLVEQASAVLADWGYEASLHEIHHKHKQDSPSGTAKALLQRMGSLAQKAQVHSSRIGSVVGTHEVWFAGPGDLLTLRHEAQDRTIFARGALMASRWAAQQPAPGLFSMSDVIFGKS